eukprot:CAMPEP_0182928582 /NCGR_PEP_ID=MMETSP0105_2-20130417/15659_1 /TAXON_ID=81532 ORGANISM="Acanthoeca-like sp., Strain 10tr" /NCGR_SAMPLE_ID=MMETSP0105_2 /ASSEMBLY_ACC=CAM_ASM_000205 /LENGTH=1795 /DNA_ID=CAMNT_0025066587 /DNA_START=139 /DNA_END=5526 /DNA_ORIENTATION=-
MGAFTLLMWKNGKLHQRRPIGTCVQILLPVAFIGVLWLVRNLTAVNKKIMCQRDAAGQLVGDQDLQLNCEYQPFAINPELSETQALVSKCGTVDRWTVGYTPNEPAVAAILTTAETLPFLTGNLSADAVTPYNSEGDMVNTLNALSGDNAACRVGVTFTRYPGDPSGSTDYAYRLRFDAIPGGYDKSQSGTSSSRKSWETAKAFPTFLGQGPRGRRDGTGGCSYPSPAGGWGNSSLEELLAYCAVAPPDEEILCFQCALGVLEMDFGTDTPGYVGYEYMAWESLINRAIASELLPPGPNRDAALEKMLNVELQRFPYPQYTQDGFLYAIQFGLPLLLMLSYMYSALTITRNVVHEKERRLKESMKMMGLPNWAHWLAWFCTAFIMLGLSNVLMAIEIHHGKILPNSDPSLICVYLLAFSAATISFCFLLSTLFKKASTAAVLTAIVWYFSYLPYQSVIARDYPTISTAEKTQFCLLSTTCMSIGAAVISQQEGNGAGVTWENWAKPISTDDDFTFASVIFLLIFDLVLYFALTLYIEGVFPGEFGIPLPWYFPCSPSFWCGKSSAEEDDAAAPARQVDEASFEAPPPDVVAGISLVGLRKVFGGKVAVAGSNLDMYRGQITALLGHNGAGKTTTMSMITGLFPPTSGTAVINGSDVTTDVKGVQRSLGICPQHDVLFDTLTVQEHLQFFCRLKGVPASQVQDEVNSMLASLKLLDKRHAQSKTLSGGQKRRLSTGMAFVGGSEVVILDEPTSGMDPAARRATWELIKKYTANRTILLSTHFMDEADVLGDRIAIMSEGVVKCAGTSIFLKGLYGVGYSLTMLVGPTGDAQTVLEFVQRYVPAAEIQSNVGAEMSILLPRGTQKNFPDLFASLDKSLVELAIQSYGCTVTTMEEVFLKVGEVAHEGDEAVIDIQGAVGADAKVDPGTLLSQHYEDELPNEVSLHGEKTPLVGADHANGYITGRGAAAGEARLSGSSRKVQQLRAMVKKRMYNTARNKWTVLAQLIPPLLFTLMALIFNEMNPPLAEAESRSLDNIRTNYGSGAHVWLASSDPSTQFNTTLLQEATGTPVGTITSTTASTVQNWIIANSNGTSDRTYDFNRYNPVVIEYLEADDSYRCWFNGQGYHSVAECLSLVHGTILARYMGAPSMGFTTANDPLPYTDAEKAEEISDSSAGFSIAFSVLFGTSPLIASFIIFLVKERESKAKHVQFVSGVDAFSYWGCNLAYDFLNYLIPICGVFALFAGFNVEAYIGDQFQCTATIFILYATSILPLVYASSFLFRNPSIAFVVMTLFNIVTGLALMVTVMILKQLEPDTADLLKNIFLVLPNFCFGQALTDLYDKHQTYSIYVKTGKSPEFCLVNGGVCPDNDYWAWEEPGIARYTLAMAVQTIVFSALVILIERRAIEALRNRFVSAISSGEQPVDQAEMDIDVAAEADRVRKIIGSKANVAASEDVVLVSDMRKTFRPTLFGPPKRAVRGISVGIPRNECFGLLGVNGAGKTTTFKILTGDESMSSGGAFIKGLDVATDMVAIRQNLGYCPQYDALIDVMTGREILTMFAELRGLLPEDIPTEVNKLIQFLMLGKHADKQSRTYSGGNKRKLSTAIALMGGPALVFLDEPTTGMDPGARRFLWNALLKVLEEKRSIILTSHSMEECEALCSRLAIMVNGQFQCIGSPQHLKSRFGQGYTLIARVRDMRADTGALRHFIEDAFKSVSLKEDHLGLVRYEVQEATLATIFSVMESAPQELDMDDYSVTQATLEQVFLDFANRQVYDGVADEEAVVAGGVRLNGVVSHTIDA